MLLYRSDCCIDIFEGDATPFLKLFYVFQSRIFLLEWVHTGNLTYARFDHTASVLNNGKVLVTGGSNEGGHLNSAKLYDPSTTVWIITGNLNDMRVLVTGGTAHNTSLNSAELYDPLTGRWSTTGSMTYARRLHTASVLKDGKVLVICGTDDDSQSSPELMIHSQAHGILLVT